MGRRLGPIAVVLLSGGALLPVLAQDRETDTGKREATKPRATSDGRDRERDDLVEARVRQEVLSMEVDAERQHLRQAIQQVTQLEFSQNLFGGMGRGGLGAPGAGQVAEDQRKQMEIDQRRLREEAVMAAKIRLEEMKERFLETSKELARVTRRRMELETRLGEPAAETVDVGKRLTEVERKLDALLKASKK